MPWSEDRFKRLLAERAKVLGKPVRTLLADAGVDHSTIDKAPTGSRKLDTLERIAEVFGLELCEVVGTPPPPIDPELLLTAQEMMRRVLSYRTLTVSDLRQVTLMARIYDVLAGRRAQGEWPLEAREISLMEEMLRREVRGK